VERKLATVLFVDLVDSTALVQASDPEVVRRRVTRYFEQVSRCIEQHGGTVEKFAGDAVMSAFGVPVAHEDDAERALRAAFAVLDAVHELELEARIGVESGEVVVEDADSTFATGEAVHVAARLQQTAEPGEIRIGPGVRRLAAGCIEVEDAGPVTLREGDDLWTWRATRILDETRRRRTAPFIGREAELELLHNVLGRAIRDRRGHLVTAFGEPGVGKTRLLEEFKEGVERATVLTGRVLPYGEGVTYWPLAAMVKESAGITDDDPANEAFEKLRVCCESEAVADLLAVALGVLGASEEEKTSEELAWAALRWAAQLADAQPLVLVFEDVHWADERLLDLIDYVVRSLRDAPLLVVCVARPELLESRPAWGGGVVRATTIELGPLAPTESEELAEALLGDDVPPAQRALALEKAEGNPLFLEETARMLAQGDGERIPDSVQALIAARIDRLPPDAKHVLQCAAIVGRVFWRGALDRLCPDHDVGSLLDLLLDREFITPEERSTISGDRAFRFKHGLIREVAYASTSKAQRAEEHRLFADWLGERAPDEMAEIRAHHLDDAVTLLTELEGEAPPDLVRETAAALERAGRRSLRRESFAAARRRLVRANELEPTLLRRYSAARAAAKLGDFDIARPELEGVRAEARDAGEGSIEGRTLLLLATLALTQDADVQRARELADEAADVIDPADEQAQYEAQRLLGQIGWWTGDLAAIEHRASAMLELARRLGRVDLEAQSLTDLAGVRAETDPEAARELYDRALELADESDSVDARGSVLIRRGQLELEHGHYDEARASIAEARRLFEEIGNPGQIAWALATLGEAELDAGDLDAAEHALHDASRILSPLRQRGRLVEAQRQLADVMLARGRISEAERYALAARETVGGEDAWSRALTLSTLGLVRAAQGRTSEAESLLKEASAIADCTGYRSLRRRVRERVEAFTGADVTAPART
jgi:class 3 adenylate cyclase/tetratricopeptide (TPR) repeat protein